MRTRNLSPMPIQPPPTATTGRKRTIAAAAAAPLKPTAEMEALAREAYIANTAKNAATREETAARKKLLAAMTETGIKSFSCQVRFPYGLPTKTKVVGLDVSREAKSVLVVDCVKLRALVGDDLFMQIVSASKVDIEKHTSSVVVTQVVSYSTSPEESVKVSVTK